MKNNNYSVILTLCLVIGVFVSHAEINSTLAIQESQDALFSSVTGLFSVVFYALLALTGVFSLLIGSWWTSIFERFSPKSNVGWFRWLAVACFLIVVTWIYLFSPWQFILTGPWTQLIFAAGFAQLVFLLLSPRRNVPFGWGEWSLTFFIFLFPRIVNEFRMLSDSSLISRVVTLIGYASILVLAFMLYHPFGERINSRLLELRTRLGNVRWLGITAFWLVPFIYRYAVGVETSLLYPDLRFAVLFLALWTTSFLLCGQKDRLVSIDSLVTSLGVLMLVSAVDARLMWVIDYPFGLYWSEGNRFYDYSLVFGQDLYNYPGTIINPYSSPGRYGLWGVMFLFHGLPIWVHRLWDLVLQIVPPLLFSFLITRRIKPVGLRHPIMLWITLFFIVLAPLHPPFMLASVIVAWFAFDESLVRRGISLLVAGSYLAISRWTWVFAPAAMGALIDLFLYYPHRTGNWFRRLLPTITLTVLGTAPGLYISVGTFQTTLQGESLTGKQPLLWYRLLPNDTLGPGVLMLVLLYTGPLLAFIAWWMFTKQWKLDIWQKLAVWGVLFGFFAVGLVISTKIGGGGDLHNLDMYLVTLMVVIVLGLTLQKQDGQMVSAWPSWAVGLVIILVFIPVYRFTPWSPGSDNNALLALPKSTDIDRVLSTIRAEVDRVSPKDEVLFMDQRQLLTFGYVSHIPFIPEYEKKYMMDQAMGNNAVYFKPYYKDLARKRFALIITEPLRTQLKEDMGGPFSEENDAWVTWVSNPTLCFYEPTYTSKGTNIQLLVPRENPVGCEQYLTYGE